MIEKQRQKDLSEFAHEIEQNILDAYHLHGMDDEEFIYTTRVLIGNLSLKVTKVEKQWMDYGGPNANQ